MKPQTRKPAVAGQFYPRSPRDLKSVVETYLKEAAVEPAPAGVDCIVTPHAGYVYSGPTAGHAFQRVRGKKVNRVVLLGCSHHYRFEAASIYESGVFETPLGNFAIDHPFASALADHVDSYSVEPHLPEHSLEVQLPFLAVALGDVPIVPVLFGSTPSPWHVDFGQQLAGLLEDGDLVLISTDLSHYLSEPEAESADEHALNVLMRQNTDEYTREVLHGTCAMCGAAAVCAGMACALARNAKTWQVLDYRTSARASGDTHRVVGYASVSMEHAA